MTMVVSRVSLQGLLLKFMAVLRVSNGDADTSYP